MILTSLVEMQSNIRENCTLRCGVNHPPTTSCMRTVNKFDFFNLVGILFFFFFGIEIVGVLNALPMSVFVIVGTYPPLFFFYSFFFFRKVSIFFPGLILNHFFSRGNSYLVLDYKVTKLTL